MIIHGDSLDQLTNLYDESVDLIVTDPPYGYSFMGKDWDRAVPSVDIWRECLRVLKPGAFAMVMSAPRSDVQNAMISRLMEAGFRLDFTPIYWTYASGFPKAGNIGKLVDKRMGAERTEGQREWSGGQRAGGILGDNKGTQTITKYDTPATDQAKALEGSYAGFQPKPAVEVIIVAMKPLSEKTFVDQALKNGKGITWLDDCRIPIAEQGEDKRLGGKGEWNIKRESSGDTVSLPAMTMGSHESGRFPANLLVSDDVLGAVTNTRSGTPHLKTDNGSSQFFGDGKQFETTMNTDSGGSYSRYFDLDKWYERNRDDFNSTNVQTDVRESRGIHSRGNKYYGSSDDYSSQPLPFIITPKASKSEKNKGLENRHKVTVGDGPPIPIDNAFQRGKTERQNSHPTVKPLKLMSYLITLASRPGDTVLDPFVGSGTTCLAAKNFGRKWIGIERELEYVEIARARLAERRIVPQLPAEKPEPGVPPVTLDSLTQVSLFDV